MRYRKSSYRRSKYSNQLFGTPAARHYCFKYIRSDDVMVDTTRRTGKFLAKLNIESAVNVRLARFFKKLKAAYRAYKEQRKRDNKTIEELAQCPSSDISDIGSAYNVDDDHSEEEGRAILPDVESDFDIRMQIQIVKFFKPKPKPKRRWLGVPEPWETLYEEHMLRSINTWPTRSELRNKRTGTFSERFKAFFKRAMTHGRSKIVLSTTEFYLCLLLYEFNMSQLVSFGHAFNQGGIGAAVVIYILVSFLVQMPFNMWIITMVSYSGSLSLRLFSDCIPLVSAIRYPIFFAFVIAESRRLLNFEAVVKFMFLTLFKGKIWKNCTLDSANEFCVPYFTKRNHNVDCSKSRVRDANYEYFSTQYFVQYDVFQIGNVGDELNADVQYWGDAASKFYGPALGIVSFLIASNGIAVLKKITIKAQIAVIILAAICVVSVGLNRINMKNFSWSYTNVNIGFVVNFISLSLQINSLPILMWLASMKPPDLNPATCSVVHQAIKFLVLMIMSITYATLAFDIATRYRMMNINCFTLEGNDIVFAMAPDFFATFRFSMIWQLAWLICMVLIAVIYSVYMILAATDSLIQIIPNGDSYATLFMFLVTLTVIFFRLINELPYIYQTLIQFELRGLNYINNFNFGLVVLCIYFLYHPIRLCHEYEFIFHTPPARFWTISWHFMICIAVLVLILTVIDLLSMNTNIQAQYIIAALFITCAMWLLFINCIKLSYFAIKRKSLGDLCFPNNRWGPPTLEQRTAQRRLERTQRHHLRYYCRHKCFVNAPQFDGIDKEQVASMNKIQAMRSTGVYAWFIKETILKEETVQFYNSSIAEE